MVFLCTARSVNIVNDTVTSLWFHQLNLDSRIKQAATMHNTSKQNPAIEITMKLPLCNQKMRFVICPLHQYAFKSVTYMISWMCDDASLITIRYNSIKLYQNPPKKHRPTLPDSVTVSHCGHQMSGQTISL